MISLICMLLPGVYTIMFVMTMFAIYKKRKEGGINKFTTIMLILL